jgi:asparagine synthase (glutamine-hydrolysing)
MKLLGLDEKHVLKSVARGLVPEPILARPKQPYRAPDAIAFVTDPPDWVTDLLSPAAVRRVGVFDVAGVQRLWHKCRAAAERGRLSNTDDMALVGILSTALVHHRLIDTAPGERTPVRFDTVIEASHEASLEVRMPEEGSGPR